MGAALALQRVIEYILADLEIYLISLFIKKDKSSNLRRFAATSLSFDQRHGILLDHVENLVLVLVHRQLLSRGDHAMVSVALRDLRRLVRPQLERHLIERRLGRRDNSWKNYNK